MSSARSAARPTTGLVIRKKARVFSTTCIKKARSGSRLPRPRRQTPRAEIKDQECPVCGTLNGPQRPVLQPLRGLPHWGAAAVQQHRRQPGRRPRPLRRGPPSRGAAMAPIPRPAPALAARCRPLPLTPWAASPPPRCWTPASPSGTPPSWSSRTPPTTCRYSAT